MSRFNLARMTRIRQTIPTAGWLACVLLLGLGLVVSTATAQPPAPGTEKITLLLAKPNVADRRFARAVILLLDHGQQGAWGLVLNKPDELRLAETFPDNEVIAGNKARLYWGGPVNPEVTGLLVQDTKAPSPSARFLGAGLYLADNFKLEKTLAAAIAEGKTFRAFSGYTGWAPGQLEVEFLRGDWLVAPLSSIDVLSADPETLWQQLIRGNELKVALAAN